MREGGFPAIDEPVDEGGLRKAQGWRGPAPMPGRVMVSPMAAARQTADAIVMDATVEPALRDIDHGDWAGRSFADIHGTDPDGLARWLADPASGAPGGESLATLGVRVKGWIADRSDDGDDMLVITHPMVIRAILSVALDMPMATTLRIDIAPLTGVILSFNRLWRLQAILPS